MARPKSKAYNSKGHYIRQPITPFKSQAYKGVSNNAKLIFHLMACGYTGYNNGSIVATFEGFKSLFGLSISKRTFYHCIDELIKSDLVFRVVKGHKGTASRFALCLWPIDDTDDVRLSPNIKPSKEPLERYLRHENND